MFTLLTIIRFTFPITWAPKYTPGRTSPHTLRLTLYMKSSLNFVPVKAVSFWSRYYFQTKAPEGVCSLDHYVVILPKLWENGRREG
jgi:hypothetical protein